MKKWLAILGIITCVFSLTACGSSDGVSGTPMDPMEESQWVASGEQVADFLKQITAAGQQELYADDPILGPAITSYESSMEDVGEVLGYHNEYAVRSDKEEVTINIGLDGSVHDADIVIVVSDKRTGQELSSITTNTAFSFGELMTQAALNTVLGMGTTFVILIVLALLISCFKFIPNILNAFKKKEPAKEEAPVKAAAVEEAEEEAEVDDGELIAVISAAVAAYEAQTGTASPNGFFVRSIRKSRKR